MGEMHLGRRTIETSHTDKAYYPDAGFRKGDVIEYYHRASRWILPHMQGRPLVMHRFPDGIDGEDFYHKDVPDHFPGWITTVEIAKEEGGTLRQAVCDDAATLIYIVNQGCLVPHLWLSRHDRLHHPDRLVFDLDPHGHDLRPVVDAARALRDLLDEIGLVPYVMSTGSRGLHVVAPLDRTAAYEAARTLAQDLADHLASRRPDRFTTEQAKSKRRGRLYLDTQRNAYGQTTVAPYALRALPGAPVATPLDWDELSDFDPRRITMRNLFRRMAHKDDPWRGIGRRARSLAGPREALARRRADG